MHKPLSIPMLTNSTLHLPDNPIFIPSPDRKGTIVEVGSTVLKAYLPWAVQGELCTIEPAGLEAEVVSIQEQYAYLSPFDETDGLTCGLRVRASGKPYLVPVGAYLKGQVVDGLGRIMWGQEGKVEAYRSLLAKPPNPMERAPISQALALGVKAIDGMLTCGQGQRVGIFAAAGGGKSTLLGMLCQGTQADVTVLALVGERGREVREFLEVTMSPEARAKSVVVVSTSDCSALKRMKATFTATTIAEYFRDQGLQVLLLVDSLTRYARAAREIGLASGEPPVTGGFPPSVFAAFPRLLERAGPAGKGAITALYTVLVEADNLNEPVSDEVRSILDGHIILSRKLAEQNHYPAIDVAASISRVMSQVTDQAHQEAAGKLRKMMSLYEEIELLIRVGEYREGKDLEADEAKQRWPKIKSFLQQATTELLSFDEIQKRLSDAVYGPC